MDLINFDKKKGIAKVYVTDPEDLWYLANLIDPGDLVKTKTTRKIKIGEGENAKVDKKVMTLKIEAETVDYDQDNQALRINGQIREGPETVPSGSYHALALDVGTEFILEKPIWLAFQQQKLKEATQKKYLYLLCLCDREEALLALTQRSGYQILVKIKGDVPKKGRITEIKKDFQQEIIKALDVYAGRYVPERVILASPAFFKEDIYKKITDKELKGRITLATCSDVSEPALDEVLRRPELRTVLQDSRAREEKLLVDELLQEINKKNLAEYGWKETFLAGLSGAASKLLVTDGFIKQKRTKGEYPELDDLLKKIDGLKGEIHILSSENDAGRTLDGLGGIAVLLRYKTR